MSEEEFSVIDTEVGLLGGTILLIGNVVAMTVFLLPAHLVADGVGPEIAIAMVLVALPMTFRILGQLQVGGAMPTAGGAYVYASRLIHPFFGFLLPWMVVPAIWAGQLYLAYGFAEFVRFFDLFAGVPIWALMYAVTIPFIVLNVLGIRIVAQVQMVLVAIIVAGMLLFVVPGAGAVDTSNYTPMFQDGYGPLFVAIITLSIAMHGFGLATDLGEELKDPVTNIPRVLGLSALVSVTLMSAVVIVAIGVVPLDFYVDGGQPVEAGVAAAAYAFLPDWGAAFVAVAAVVGAFTSLNTLYTAYSRQLMRAARDETIPGYFARIHPEYQTPYRAILLLSLPALGLVLAYTPWVGLGPSPVVLSAALSVSTMVGAVFGSVALWNLPKRFPNRYEYSIYRLPMPALKAVAVGGLVVSVVFLLGVSTQLLWLTGGIFCYLLVAYPVYRYRLRSLRETRGIDLEARLKDLHSYEHERAAAGSRAVADGTVASDAAEDSTTVD